MRHAQLLFTCFVCLIAFFLQGRAQSTQFVFEDQWDLSLERTLLKKGTNLHTAIKPFTVQDLNYALQDDSLSLRVVDSLTKESFILGNEKFKIDVKPIIDLSGGYEFISKSFVWESNTGLRLDVSLGPKVAIGGDFTFYTGDLFGYLEEYVDQRGVVPGFRMNRSSKRPTSITGSGYLNVSPNENFELELGFGKQFWGNGYRSFMLSDNASSYPYLKLTADFWRFKYVYLINVMRYGQYDQASRSFDISSLSTKMSAFHYLSLNAADWLEIGFFEGVIWNYKDSTGTRGVELNYLNPVIFIRPVEFALGSPDNVILGLNFNFKLSDKTSLYTQFVLDDLDIGRARGGKGFYRTKFAWQAGVRAIDLFGLKNISARTEFNLVRPYTYAHKTPEQNYTNLNESLVHNLGANFWEVIFQLDYVYKNWKVYNDLQFARVGMDQNSNDHNGSDIFISDYEIVGGIPDLLDLAYGNYFLQGTATNIFSTNFGVEYLISKASNLRLAFNYKERIFAQNNLSERNYYVGFSVKANLRNRYLDF